MAEVRKFVVNRKEREILDDLERYRELALSLGASEAKIIGAHEIIIDPRVRLKCMYPKCRWFGTNAHCPPHAPEVEKIISMVSRYKHGIFYCIRVPTEDFVGNYTDSEGQPKPAKRQLLNYKISSSLESAAFYDGYVLAVGFAGGPCKPVFCPTKDCSAIMPGQGCRAAGKARTSLEGACMYAFAMAAEAGWDIYPCGPTAENVPHGTALGMVLID